MQMLDVTIIVIVIVIVTGVAVVPTMLPPTALHSVTPFKATQPRLQDSEGVHHSHPLNQAKEIQVGNIPLWLLFPSGRFLSLSCTIGSAYGKNLHGRELACNTVNAMHTS